jgi:hypothetical protein
MRTEFGPVTANDSVVIMLVKIGDQERHKNWRSSLSLLLITVVPWVVLFWLMWPRR